MTAHAPKTARELKVEHPATLNNTYCQMRRENTAAYHVKTDVEVE
jgi:hypothetical protein